MGLVESLECIQILGKKQCRSLYWRIRAAMKKAMAKGTKSQVKFQYDPQSYALNFDDGFQEETGDVKREFQQAKFREGIRERMRDFQQSEFQEIPEKPFFIYVVIAK